MTTDGDIANIARKIDEHQRKIIDLISEIRDSDHTNAEKIANWLEENLFGHGASAQNCVHTHFDYPDRWLVYPAAIYYKATTSDAEKVRLDKFYSSLLDEEE